MRIVSLVPAATEIVAALGAADRLVGISHECDYPPTIQHLPRVTTTPIDGHAPGAIIDQAVRDLRAAGRPVIVVDTEQIVGLAPDLIITQDLCEVCAVGGGEVRRLSAALGPGTRIVSLGARDVSGLWQDIRTLGSALDLSGDAEELVLGLRSRLDRVAPAAPRRASQAVGIPRVLCVEWLDPLFVAGHWVPELVLAAGGEDVGAEARSPSVRRSWSEVARLRPDLVIVMLCGMTISRAETELAALADRDALRLLGSVPTWILDGNAYTSRPGPRLVDGAERIHAAMRGSGMDGLRAWRSAS